MIQNIEQKTKRELIEIVKIQQDEYIKLQGDFDKINNMLDAYKTFVNRIDDYFEYANQSIKDRMKVHLYLGSLTNRLSKLAAGKAL
jgi:iron uptake system EfeUOB component EfeO/EfeM